MKLYALLFLFASFLPVMTYGKSLGDKESELETEIVVESSEIHDAEFNAMLNRLNEIRDMDMSALSVSEKRELREEVRDIKKAARESNKGIYLSVGAIIIVILLLILLL
jgi:hypothetical protein